MAGPPTRYHMRWPGCSPVISAVCCVQFRPASTLNGVASDGAEWFSICGEEPHCTTEELPRKPPDRVLHATLIDVGSKPYARCSCSGVSLSSAPPGGPGSAHDPLLPACLQSGAIASPFSRHQLYFLPSFGDVVFPSVLMTMYPPLLMHLRLHYPLPLHGEVARCSVIALERPSTP